MYINQPFTAKACFAYSGWLAVILFFTFLASAVGQEREVAFRSLSISDGLSQSSVISITQDHKGFLWFGTRDGLNKYDGHKFTVYKHNRQDSASISNNDILEIITDSRGDLWIGTFNGLNRYDYSKDRFISYYNETGDSTSLSDNSIWSICESANGNIWVGTANGLNRFNKETETFERFYHDQTDASSISNNYILDLFRDREGIIWVATAKGLNRIDIDKNNKVNFTRFLPNERQPNSLSDQFLQSIAEDEIGNLWIGTKYGGLNKFNKSSGNIEVYRHQATNSTSISSNDIRSLVFDQEGKLWIGTYAGLNVMDTQKGSFDHFFNDKDDPTSLSKNSVKSIFLDTKGSLWIGTYYGGINMLDWQNSNFKNYKYTANASGLSFDVVSALVEDKQGKVYIGTEGGGINVLNRRTGEISQLHKSFSSHLSGKNNVKSLYLENESELWVGTFHQGLKIIDLNKGTAQSYKNEPQNKHSVSDNNIYAIARENDSLYWIGTHGGGLNLFNRHTQQFSHIKEGKGNRLTSNFVRTLLKDSKGNLWVGTQYGLNLLLAHDENSPEIKFKPYFYDQKKMSGEDILSIYEDSQSRIWVGTNESGLNLYDPQSDSFINYNLYEMSGSSSNVVHGILEDEHGSLWISTNQGILSLNPEDKSFRGFDESDGLVSNEFNNSSCLRTADGQMYFGSLEGLTVFHPDSIRVNKYAPPVVLTDFRLFGKSLKPGNKEGILDKTVAHTEKLTLDYDQAIFSIEFAIPNYINPSKNHYAYRLKGLEEDWNYTTANIATYTIQKHGTYTFEVKGANNDDFWNSAPTSLQVTVLPAPWKTWWAFVGYALVIMIALYLLINIIWSRSQLKHELELEHLNKERQESLNQMKLQFFTNISHEFRTPLTLILGPLEEIIGNYKGSNALYKQLLAIEKNANRMLRLIDQLMDFRKFENNHLKLRAAEGNIVAFVKEVYLSFKQYAGLHHFTYEFLSETDEIALWYDRDKMERVVFNLISNAFKYTPEGGHIKVSVKQFSGRVEITVSDSGVGMAPEHLDKIFERFYEVDQTNTPFNTKYKKGTGIGLALAKGIVDLHSGALKVESRPGEGSDFTVELPLGRHHLQEDQIIQNFKGSDDLANYKIAPYLPDGPVDPLMQLELPKDAPTILVVEDNNDVRKYIVQLFRHTYNILEAPNGKEGQRMAVQYEPDIIISDVMMPEVDGIEFCSRIKSDIKTSHIPVILLTARTSLVFKHEGLEMGADDYINKPFNVKELKIKVKNLITSRKKLKEKFTSESVIKPSEITVTSMDEKLMEKALEIVEENISNELFDIATFSEELGVSRTMLFTKIKAWTSLTPNEFLHAMRMKRAAQLLEQNKLNVSQVGFQVGFKNPKYFSKCFQRHFSETPTSYAKRFSSPDEMIES